MRPTKSIAIIGMAILGLITLTACSPKAHISATLHEGKVRFLLCDSFAANKIVVRSSPLRATTTDYQPTWVAVGSGQTTSVPVSYGAPPPGFASVGVPHQLVPEDSLISIAYMHLSGGKLESDMVGIFDGSRLSSTKWLNWDGNSVDNPC
jgi:hypothetical protein